MSAEREIAGAKYGDSCSGSTSINDCLRGSQRKAVDLASSEEASDPYDLERFKSAQDYTFDTALREVSRGRKETHWMWYVFPAYNA